MKALAVLLLAGLALLGATSSSVGAAGARPHISGIVFHNGRHSVRANAQLSLHAAARSVQASAPTCNGSSCSPYENAINRYFTDVAHDSGTTSNVYSVATQYSGITYNETFGGSYVDTNAYPPNFCNDAAPGGSDPICLTNQQLQNEIGNDISANGWPNGGTTNLFFIFTPSGVGICDSQGNASSGNACSTNVFCAYHSETNGGIVYAVQPYNATIPGGGCDSGNKPNRNDADLTLNTVSHEQNEAITDPAPPSGWISNDRSGGGENGDLCAWTFGTPGGGVPGVGNADGTEWNQAINGDHYWLQEEYSNESDPTHTTNCVQHRGGVPNPPDPLLNGGDGIGPLVWNGGPVMTTNTVYAIYWVPGAAGAAPVNSQAPVVSGAAAVGQALTTSDGTWSNSPTSYAYQWQSCSSSGANCTSISGATTSSYTVQPGDAGHTIVASVSATNAAGTAQAVSSPTAVVVDLPQASAKPRITGKAKVGKRLTATSGSWTGSPASFRYQWLRCSAAGGSCAPIAHATGSRYKVGKHDVRHRLRVAVTATNLAGHASSTSASTARIKS